MRNRMIGLGLFIGVLSSGALAGCTVAPDAAERYAVAEPLSVKMVLLPNKQPDDAGQVHTFQATVLQDEQIVRDADFVHFEIWKADGTLTYGMEPAEIEQDGVYAIQKALPKPGLYYMKVHVGKRNEMIMPTKQFIIGELSKADLKLLQDGAKPSSGNEGHHH